MAILHRLYCILNEPGHEIFRLIPWVIIEGSDETAGMHLRSLTKAFWAHTQSVDVDENLLQKLDTWIVLSDFCLFVRFDSLRPINNLSVK